jgi:2-dehydro-3-deoxyphosphooctonate aldolase (KDO 8-P synthase)
MSNALSPFVVIAGPCVLEGDGEINRHAAQHLKTVLERLQASHPNQIQMFFKSSYDKANRTSSGNYRGPGVEKGLAILKDIRDTYGLPILTDVHSPQEAEAVGPIVDFIQIPAFLCRQTDLLVAAGETGKPINIKKGQFLSPKEVQYCADKVKSTGNEQIFITERGTTFGYNNLVVDMRSIPIVQSLGLPIIFDATHSVQLPGGGEGKSSGQREFAPVLARAAVAAGCDGLFIETHPSPDNAPSDGPNMLPLEWVEPLLETCLRIRDTVGFSGFSANSLSPDTLKAPALV